MSRVNISGFTIFITAFFLAGAALLFNNTDAGARVASQTGSECLDCHPRSFAGEVHGLGTTNDAFKTAWDELGNQKDCLACHATGFDAVMDTWKADKISCEACHSPIPDDHPSQNIPVDRSNELCGKCHNDSRFGWEDYKASVHYQQNMTCDNCHDPHLPKRAAGEDASAACVKCHGEIAQRSTHSAHAQNGVTCIQCHLGPKKGVDGYHEVPDHSFKPVVETCNNCHVQQMHDASPLVVVTPTLMPTVAVPTPTMVLASPTPKPSGLPGIVTPLSSLDFFFIGAGLLGLGAVGGMALSPLLDKVNQLFSKPRK